MNKRQYPLSPGMRGKYGEHRNGTQNSSRAGNTPQMYAAPLCPGAACPISTGGTYET